MPGVPQPYPQQIPNTTAMMTFKEYGNLFHEPTLASPPRKPKATTQVVPDQKRRLLLGKIVGMIQELTNKQQLTDAERYLFAIASALQLLLSEK